MGNGYDFVDMLNDAYHGMSDWQAKDNLRQDMQWSNMQLHDQFELNREIREREEKDEWSRRWRLW